MPAGRTRTSWSRSSRLLLIEPIDPHALLYVNQKDRPVKQELEVRNADARQPESKGWRATDLEKMTVNVDGAPGKGRLISQPIHRWGWRMGELFGEVRIPQGIPSSSAWRSFPWELLFQHVLNHLAGRYFFGLEKRLLAGDLLADHALAVDEHENRDKGVLLLLPKSPSRMISSLRSVATQGKDGTVTLNGATACITTVEIARPPHTALGAEIILQMRFSSR